MIIYEEVFEDFQKQKVQFVVVGGIASNLHGAMRGTADLDILVKMDDKNIEKVVKILKKQGYQVRQPVDPMNLADQKTRETWIRKKNMKAFNFYKDRELKEVDIIIDSPVSYESAAAQRIRLKAGRLMIPVISIEHLIKMKQKAGRPIDRRDVAELKEIKRLRGKK